MKKKQGNNKDAVLGFYSVWSPARKLVVSSISSVISAKTSGVLTFNNFRQLEVMSRDGIKMWWLSF